MVASSASVRGPLRRRPNAFTAGLQAERLFWRSLGRGGVAVALSVGSRLFLIAVELVFVGLAVLAGRGRGAS